MLYFFTHPIVLVFLDSNLGLSPICIFFVCLFLLPSWIYLWKTHKATELPGLVSIFLSSEMKMTFRKPSQKCLFNKFWLLLWNWILIFLNIQCLETSKKKKGYLKLPEICFMWFLMWNWKCNFGVASLLFRGSLWWGLTVVPTYIK